MWFKGKIKGTDLIREVYSALSGHSYYTIAFPGNGVFPIIANDSDHHRIRTGHMNYKTVDLKEIGNRCWALSLGKAWGDYPADGYGNDIIAINLFETQGTKEDDVKEMNERPEDYIARRAIEGNFHNSLIHTKDGRLRLVGDFISPVRMKFNPFGEKLLEEIRPNAPGYVFLEREPGERENLLVTIYPPGGEKGGVFDRPEYSREFIDVILNSAEKVLSQFG